MHKQWQVYGKYMKGIWQVPRLTYGRYLVPYFPCAKTHLVLLRICKQWQRRTLSRTLGHGTMGSNIVGLFHIDGSFAR